MNGPTVKEEVNGGFGFNCLCALRTGDKAQQNLTGPSPLNLGPQQAAPHLLGLNKHTLSSALPQGSCRESCLSQTLVLTKGTEISLKTL